jgi:hypothetical protein
MDMEINITHDIRDKSGRIFRGIEIDSYHKGSDIIKELDNQVMKSLELKVPKHKRHLLQAISTRVVRTGKYSAIMAMSIEVDNKKLPRNYGTAQEYGFEPHYVSMFKPEIREWLRMHNYVTRKNHRGLGKGVKGKIWVSKYTPFVQPTINEVLNEGNVMKVINAHASQIGRKV